MIGRTIIAVLTVGLLGASCSSGGDSDVSEGSPAATEAPTDPPATDPPATDRPVTDPPATDPPATDPPTSDASSGTGSAADSSGIADVVGVTAIEIITPASGGGERPLLEWAPVAGAEEYNVVALTADGKPYWAWVGRTNSVAFGGGDPAGDAGQLAVVYEPLTWSVAAFGPDGALLALSDRSPLAP